MAKKKKKFDFKDNLPEDEILWRDRKRTIFGLPWSFTVYEVTPERFIRRKGLFVTETDEIMLYRVLDIKMIRTLGQKLNGVGTIVLYSADQSSHTERIVSVKHPDKVRRFLSSQVEKIRNEKGLTGREMFGTAGTDMDHSECDHMDE